MTADMFKWRITDNLSDIQQAIMVRVGTNGIPLPSQTQYRDHAVRVSQSEGGMARHGYRNFESLWLKLTPCQADDLRTIVDNTKPENGGSGLLYMTIKPLDGSNVDWMDISGKPDLSDIAPDAPIIGAVGYIHSNIKLRLNNVAVISTDPTF